MVAFLYKTISFYGFECIEYYFGAVAGYRLPDGSYLENAQLEPDVKVANAPETVVDGEDTQLKTAVDELLKSFTE